MGRRKEWTIKADPYGLDVSEDDLEALEYIYDDGDIAQYFSDEVLAIARDREGDVIGGVTQSGGDEWSIGVDEGWQGHGIGTEMIKKLIAKGGSGYMVAGTDAGFEFLYGLYHRLSKREREEMDVPLWEGIEDEGYEA